jgi:hypothetical protein
MTLKVFSVGADRLEGEVAAALFFADQRPLSGSAGLLDWRLNGLLTNLLHSGRVTGDLGERLLVPANGKIAASRVLFLGAGRSEGLQAAYYRQLLRQLIETCLQAGFTPIALGLEAPAGLAPKAVRELVAGLLDDPAGRGLDCQVALHGPSGGLFREPMDLILHQ